MIANSMRKQLNIRSNDAYERAHRLARQRNTSVTAVIEQALRRYEAGSGMAVAELSPEEVAENGRILDEMKHNIWGGKGPPPGATSDHSWMYDENGLPK
jgi:predicted transcriptional regulator